MIELKQIAQHINTLLNTEVENYPILNGEHIKYVFNVVANTADYKKATIDGNTATFYLNGILTQNGSTVEGEGFVSAIVNASLEIGLSIQEGLTDDTPEFASTVCAVINSAFSQNSVTNIMGNDGKKYTLGMNYNLTNSGIRDVRSQLGDSFTFGTVMSFFIIESGVNSNDMEYYMLDSAGNTHRIFMIVGGMTRGAQQETQVTSGSQGIAKSITTAKVLTFTFVTPMRYDYVSKEISDYINTKAIKVYTILKKKLYKDDGSPVDENSRPEYYEFKMAFSECSENYDTVKNVGLQATMVEAM